MSCKPLPKRAKRTPFSPSYRREELCFCTEELGSESISCRSVMETAKTVMEPRGHHGSLQTCGYHERNVLRADAKCAMQPCKSGKSLQLNDMPSRNAATGLFTHVRAFPPPISSLLTERPIMRSIKADGRFLLQRVNTTSNSPFRSVRENGRLRLMLASSSSSSGLDCNGERQHSLHNYETEENDEQSKAAIKAQDAVQGKAFKGLKNAEQEAKISFEYSTVCMPRSMPLRRAAPCRCLPTLRLLLEKAQRFQYNVQASHGSLIECEDIQGPQDQGSALHTLKSNGAPLIASSGLQLLGRRSGHRPFSSAVKPCITAASATAQLGHDSNELDHESNALCCAHNTRSKKKEGYAILSLSFNGLILLVVLEGTKATIKAADFRHYKDAPATISSRSAKAEKQISSESKELGYYTWQYPSKPMDFRIAA